MKKPKNISNTSVQATSLDKDSILKTGKRTLSGVRSVRAVSNTQDAKRKELDIYTRLIRKSNTVEDVVTIGAMIQREINNHNKLSVHSPSSHSGNWKSSLFHNLMQLSSTFIPNSSPLITGSRELTEGLMVSSTLRTQEGTLENVPHQHKTNNSEELAVNEKSKGIKKTKFMKNVTSFPELPHVRKKRAGGDESASYSGKKRAGDVLEENPPKKTFRFSSLSTNEWSNIDITLLKDSITPDVEQKINTIRNGLSTGENITQVQFDDVDNLLRNLFDNLSGVESKKQIRTLLRELHIAIKETGRDIILRELPSLVPTNSYPILKNFHLDSVKTGLWTPDDINMLNSVFPDFMFKIEYLKRRLSDGDEIYQAQFDEIDGRLRILIEKLSGIQAKSEVHTLLSTIHKAIQKTGRSLILQELPQKPKWLMVDFRERNPNMMDSWSSHDKMIRDKIAPSFMYNLRKLAEKKTPTLSDINKMDTLLIQMLEQFTGENAKATVQSIRKCMFNHFQSFTVPVRKQAHLIFSLRPEAVLTLPLHSLSQELEYLTIWIDTQQRYDKALNLLLGKAIRRLMVDDKIGSILSLDINHQGQDALGVEHIPLLETYKNLIVQNNHSADVFRLIRDQIKQDPVLRRFIINIQASTPLLIQKLLMKKDTEWGTLTTYEQQQAFLHYFDKINNDELSHQAREYLNLISSPDIQVTDLPEHVVLKKLDEFFKPSSLYHLLNRHHYNFPDRDALMNILLILEGHQGLFSKTLNPVLSGEVIRLMENLLGTEKAHSPDIRKAVLQSMETYLSQPHLSLSFDEQQAFSQFPLNVRQKLASSLQQLPKEHWFHQLDWATPLLGAGIRFSTNGQHLTDNAVMAGEHALRTRTQNFGAYLDALYYFHRRALENKLTTERIQRKLHSLDMGILYTPEQIENFISKMEKNPYQSLTSIHRLLAGDSSPSLSMAALSWNSRHYPIINNNLIVNLPDGSMDISSSLMIPEDVLGSSVELSTEDRATHKEIADLKVSDSSVRHSLLNWLDVYSTHISIWDDTTHRWQATSTEFSPQSLLTDGDGLCMGISLASLQANTAESWKILQQNLSTGGALRVRSDIQKLPISGSDLRFLTALKNSIYWLQKKGNYQIRPETLPVDIHPFTFTAPSELAKLITRYSLQQVLITTEKHSLTLQKQGSQWRVFDPSLGSALFGTLDNATEFLLESVRLTPVLQKLYGTSGEHPSLTAYYSVNPESWKHFISLSDKYSNAVRDYIPVDMNILTIPYRTTYEVLKDSSVVLNINNHKITIADAYQLGFEYQGKLLDIPLEKYELSELSINGHILKHYLEHSSLSSEQASNIRSLIRSVGVTPGTPEPSNDDIRDTGLGMVSLHQRLQLAHQHSEKIVVEWILALKKHLGLTEKDIRDGRYSVSNIMLDKDRGLLSFDIDDGTRAHSISFPIDEHLKYLDHLQSIADGSHFTRKHLAESNLIETGVLDADIGMAVLGIIQTARALQSEGKVDSLSMTNMVLSGKQTLEATVGNLLLVVTGQALRKEELVTFRTERQIAELLRKVGSRLGGTLGMGISKLSSILELPILDLGVFSGNLISSAAELSLAKTCEEKGMLASRVAFNSISLFMSTGSLVVPELAVPVIVVGALGMGIESIASNLGAAHDRYYSWSNYRDFMVSNEKQVMLAAPDRGLLDFSGNHICGGIHLDLSLSPPSLSGHPSFDNHEIFGHMPDKTPSQIRELIGYGYSALTTPLPDLGRRRWPNELPDIPPGNYDTVILGYGRTLKLNTAVEYISDWLMYDYVNNRASGGYWEVVKSQPEIYHTSMMVTGGDRLLTVVSPDVGSEYQNYIFTIIGGSGGVCIQPANLGVYDISGDVRTDKNILLLTEKSMGSEDDFLSFYKVDLMEKNWQDIFINKGVGPSVHKSYPDIYLRVRLKNINQLICHGDSIVCNFRGNKDNNVFSANMGRISSGPGGHNQYYINLKSGRYPVSYRNAYPVGLYEHSESVGLAGVLLILEEGAHSHRIFLDSPLAELFAPTSNCVALRNDAANQAPHIPVDFLNTPDEVTRRFTFHFENNATGYLSLQTSDGAQLVWHGEKGWLLSQVNLTIWQQQHPNDKVIPESVIHVCQNLTWPKIEDTVTLISDDYRVEYESGRNSFSYILQKDNITLEVSQNIDSTIFGSRNSRYIIQSIGSNLLSLFIVNDPESPEVINLQNSKLSIYGRCGDNIITLSHGERTLRLGILPDSKYTDFTNSTTSIVFPNGKIMLLKDLYRKLSQSTYPIVLFEENNKNSSKFS